MDREYDVEVVFRQRVMYRITAADREAAEKLAESRWRSGAETEVPGYNWCELEAVGAAEAADEAQHAQDAEVVLRFMRERERLLSRLGVDPFDPASNDAISADRVAADLGWSRAGASSGTQPDVARATMALERLCQEHRVICFERPRVRTGERGEIRLYCTPEYLEQLSDSLEGVDRQAV